METSPVKNNPVAERREQISQLAQAVLGIGGTTDTGSICPVKHRFAPGLYCREIFIPKGALIVGKIHATSHFNTILQGECKVITTTEKKHIKAPDTWITEAGEQKAVYALEDVIWQTYHVTDSTDLKEIEAQVIVDSFDELEQDKLLEQCQELLE